MAVEISQERVPQRTVELEHQPQVTSDWNTKPVGCPRDQPPPPGLRLIRTAPRGSEHSDERRPDCANSSSTHADGAAAREQQIQPLKERVQQHTPEEIVGVPVDTDRSPRSRGQMPSISTRSWMCQACANAKSQSSRQPSQQLQRRQRIHSTVSSRYMRDAESAACLAATARERLQPDSDQRHS